MWVINMKKHGSGWHKESRRHSLAKKGIKTANGVRSGMESKLFGKHDPDICPKCKSKWDIKWDHDADAWYCSNCKTYFGKGYIDKFMEGRIKVREQQRELDEIASWLRDTTEEYDDWDWDGEVLIIFLNGKPIERYSKLDLIENNIITTQGSGAV